MTQLPIQLIPYLRLVVEFVECYLAGTFDYSPPQLLEVKLYGEAVIRYHFLLFLRRSRKFLDLDGHDCAS